MTKGQCPGDAAQNPDCYTPQMLWDAYGITSLMQHGFTGKGQSVIDVVSYGSPTLQQDLNVFDEQFGLPSTSVEVLSPLGTVPFNRHNKEMEGWASETELDVEVIHAIAPGAHIVVLTSPIDETEGRIGLPEFMKLEQYAISHRLGFIFSQSFAASEATLADQAGQRLVKAYADFYQQATTQQKVTILSGSGDNGATDWNDLAATRLSPTPTVTFPADVPWVTAIGGTTLRHHAHSYNERAWSESGGGVSHFFKEPDFQHSLPASIQSQLAGQRGMPDIAANADPATGMDFYFDGQWDQVGGTSASTPLVAGMIAIANQMAGHPLGFINPGMYKLLQYPTAAHMAFRDITGGDNGVHRGGINIKGFSAGSGWDAVTGWGTPQASQFLPALITALR